MGGRLTGDRDRTSSAHRSGRSRCPPRARRRSAWRRLSTNIGWPPGAIIINADDYAQAWESSDASAYEMTAGARRAPETVRREVQRALGPASGLTVQTSRQREQRQRAASRQGLSRLSQISTLVLIAVVLAMVAAMGNMIWQRAGTTGRAEARRLQRPRRLAHPAVRERPAGRLGLLDRRGLRALRPAAGEPRDPQRHRLSGRLLAVATGVALQQLCAGHRSVAVAITAIPGYLIARRTTCGEPLRH